MTVPDRYQAPCALCSEPVDTRPGRGSCRSVSGWAPVRAIGGPNQIRLAEWADSWAHKYCVDGEKLRPKTWEELTLF